MKTQAAQYADKTIDSLSIGQLTINDLRWIIIKAWEAGYKAGKNSNSSSNNNFDFIDIEERTKELQKRNKEVIYPTIDPSTPYVPLVSPAQPLCPNITPNVPWLPIVYC